jgi:thiazole synthase
VSGTIQITLNGVNTPVPAEHSVLDLVSSLGLNPQQVAVEVNREIVTRATWSERVLSPADEIEVVHFVGGGEG